MRGVRGVHLLCARTRCVRLRAMVVGVCVCDGGSARARDLWRSPSPVPVAGGPHTARVSQARLGSCLTTEEVTRALQALEKLGASVLRDG